MILEFCAYPGYERKVLELLKLIHSDPPPLPDFVSTLGLNPLNV